MPNRAQAPTLEIQGIPLFQPFPPTGKSPAKARHQHDNIMPACRKRHDAEKSDDAQSMTVPHTLPQMAKRE